VDGLHTTVVTHQLQVERRTGEVRRPETDVLPLCHATRLGASILGGLGEQSPTLLKVGGWPIVVIALGSSDSCVKSEVSFTVWDVGG